MRGPERPFWRSLRERWKDLPALRGLAGWLAVLLLSASAALASGNRVVDELLKEGSAFHRRADYAHSIPILKRATRLDPRNFQANLLLGVGLLRSGEASSAIAPLRIAVETHPKDASAAEALAKAATSIGDFALAAGVLEASVAQSAGDVKAIQTWAGYCLDRFRVLGLTLRSTKRGEGYDLRVEAASRPEGSEERESLLRESAAANPDQRGIWGELGVAQLKLRQRTAVETSLNEARTREPDGAETQQLEALLAAVAGNWPESERLLLALGARSPVQLRRILALWPRELVPAQETRGQLWDCLRQPETSCSLAAAPTGGGSTPETLYAEGRWEQLAARPRPETAQSPEWLWRGVALAEIGDCLGAIPSLERGLKSGHGAGEFWLEVCYASEAERAAALLHAAGDQVAVLQLHGDVRLRLNQDPAGAQAQYAEALRLRPRDPHLLERSATAYMGMGRMAEARKSAFAALSLDPGLVPALTTLVQIEMNDRQYEDAIVPLKKLAVLNPADAWVSAELGRAYAQLNHPEQALHYLQSAMAAGYPDQKGVLHAMMAKVLRKLGREAEAQEAAQAAAKLAEASQQPGADAYQ